MAASSSVPSIKASSSKSTPPSSLFISTLFGRKTGPSSLVFDCLDLFMIDDLKTTAKIPHSYFRSNPQIAAAKLYEFANAARCDLTYLCFNKLFRFLNSRHVDAPWAQFYLGRMYIEGLGTNVDIKKGMKHLAQVPPQEKLRSHLYIIKHFMSELNPEPELRSLDFESILQNLISAYENEILHSKNLSLANELAIAIGHLYGYLDKPSKSYEWFEKAFLIETTLQQGQLLAKTISWTYNEESRKLKTLLPLQKLKNKILSTIESLTAKLKLKKAKGEKTSREESSLLKAHKACSILAYLESPTALSPEEKAHLEQDPDGALELGLQLYDPTVGPTHPTNQSAEEYFQKAIQQGCLLVEEKKLKNIRKEIYGLGALTKMKYITLRWFLFSLLDLSVHTDQVIYSTSKR